MENGEDEQAVERLSRLVRPFLLRRRKSDPGIVPNCRRRPRRTTRSRSPGNRPRSTRRWCASRCSPSRPPRAWAAAVWC
ncbi:hypothetical protein ACR6C2_38390 [Streptomyces sp. INA 01156]